MLPLRRWISLTLWSIALLGWALCICLSRLLRHWRQGLFRICFNFLVCLARLSLMELESCWKLFQNCIYLHQTATVSTGHIECDELALKMKKGRKIWSIYNLKLARRHFLEFWKSQRRGWEISLQPCLSQGCIYKGELQASFQLLSLGWNATSIALETKCLIFNRSTCHFPVQEDGPWANVSGSVRPRTVQTGNHLQLTLLCCLERQVSQLSHSQRIYNVH